MGFKQGMPESDFCCRKIILMAAWRMDGKAGRAEFGEISQTSTREMGVPELGKQQ